MVLAGDEYEKNEMNEQIDAAEKEKETKETPMEEQANETAEKEKADAENQKNEEEKPHGEEEKEHDEETKVQVKEEAAKAGEPKSEEPQDKKEDAELRNIEPEKNTANTTTESHLLMPNDSKIKFVQESFGFSSNKTFEAPKFHPYLLMKNYTVQHVDPIIKKAKPRRFMCCS